MPIVTVTTMTLIELGRRCTKRIRLVDAPIAMAAATWSVSRSERTCARTSRAMPTHPKATSATVTTK